MAPGASQLIQPAGGRHGVTSSVGPQGRRNGGVNVPLGMH